MNAYLALLLGVVLGFVVAQACYLLLLNRSMDREQRLHELLSASRQRYREISAMLDEARRR